MMHRSFKAVVAMVMGVLLMSSVVSCGSTQQPARWAPLGEEIKGAGFLGDLYPLLKEGEEDKALLRHLNPKFRDQAYVGQFTKILLDPVVLYAGLSSKLPEIPQAEQEHIAQNFYANLYDQLSKDYEMVTQPGPNTLHAQVAIVDAEESQGTLEAISYIPIPVGVPGVKLALVQLKSQSTGKPPFAGEVTIEGKYTDALTGEVLSAIIDRRVGARRPVIGLFESATYDDWNDVDEAFRYWAEKARYRLCQRRGGSNCVEPEE